MLLATVKGKFERQRSQFASIATPNKIATIKSETVATAHRWNTSSTSSIILLQARVRRRIGSITMTRDCRKGVCTAQLSQRPSKMARTAPTRIGQMAFESVSRANGLDEVLTGTER